MYQMTATLIDLTRQQMAGMHTLTVASLSGAERAQQCALQITRQMLEQQLDAVGRATASTAQAAGTMLDAAHLQPAMDGLLRTQRDLAQAMTDTQRRCLDVVAAAGQPAEAAPLARLGEAWQQSMQHWQQWTEQWLAATRARAEQWSQQVAQQGTQAAQATTDIAEATAAQAAQSADAVAQSMQTTASMPTDQPLNPPAALLRAGVGADAQADEVSRRLEASAQSARRENAGDGARDGKRVVEAA